MTALSSSTRNACKCLSQIIHLVIRQQNGRMDEQCRKSWMMFNGQGRGAELSLSQDSQPMVYCRSHYQSFCDHERRAMSTDHRLDLGIGLVQVQPLNNEQ